MAERFTSQRCQDCQGGLEYNKAGKYWECPYCGKIYERELRFNKVQIDGLAGINDLVRSTLSKVVKLDFSGAERDYLECEKINHLSVGTAIAGMALSLFKAFTTKDRQAEIAKLNSLAQKFSKDFPTIEDEEEILYEYIASQDIYAMLVVLYSTIKQTKRLEQMYLLLDCKEVYEQSISKFLLNVLLKDGKVEDADVIIGNLSEANSRFGIMSVLKDYPGNDKKVQHIQILLKRYKSEFSLAKTFEDYFDATEDPSDVVIGIFLAAIEKGVQFNVDSTLEMVLENCTDEDAANRVFGALSHVRFSDQAAETIVNWCLLEAESAEICAIGIKSLFESNTIFELTYDMCVLLFDSDQDPDLIIGKFKVLLSTLRAPSRCLDRLISYVLLETDGETRGELFDELFSRVNSVSLSVLNDYVLKVYDDGEEKRDILQKVLEKSKTSFDYSLLSNYLRTDIDESETREGVIETLLEAKLIPDCESYTYYLVNEDELHSDEMLDLLDQKNIRPSSSALDQYFRNVDPDEFNPKIAYLATKASYRLSAEAYARYILEISEPQNRKAHSAVVYLEQTDVSALRNAQFSATVAGKKVTGNLAEIYIFVTGDEAFVVQEVLGCLKKQKIRIDETIEVEGEKKSVKMKKFIEENPTAVPASIKSAVVQFL